MVLCLAQPGLPGLPQLACSLTCVPTTLTVWSSGAREVTRRLTQAFQERPAFASPVHLVSARALSAPCPRPLCEIRPLQS